VSTQFVHDIEILNELALGIKLPVLFRSCLYLADLAMVELAGQRALHFELVNRLGQSKGSVLERERRIDQRMELAGGVTLSLVRDPLE
jgi:hypothetical protein